MKPIALPNLRGLKGDMAIGGEFRQDKVLIHMSLLLL